MGSTTAAPAPAASALPPPRTAASTRPSDASARLRAALGQRGVRTRARAGRVVLRQAEPAGQLFLLEAGVVELSCVVESGEGCLLDLVLPGELFGGSPGALPFSAIAREECVLLGSSEVSTSCAPDPFLARALAEIASERALRLAERLRDTLVLDAAERVMAVACDLAERRSTGLPEGRRVDVSVTQEDLARMTGCTRETVNRTLRRLLEERRLLRRGRRYVVPYRSEPP